MGVLHAPTPRVHSGHQHPAGNACAGTEMFDEKLGSTLYLVGLLGNLQKHKFCSWHFNGDALVSNIFSIPFVRTRGNRHLSCEEYHILKRRVLKVI